MHVNIEGKSYLIKKFGRSDLSVFDWSGAQSVTNLDLSIVSEVNLLMKGSAVTDLTLSSIAAVNSYSDLENVYLHLPYGAQRSSYSYMGFKRVLIGEEQPSYPEPSDQDCWVIAGDREGEYFSIQLYDSRFRVVEIFSQEESVTLPVGTPYAGGSAYWLTGVGYTARITTIVFGHMRQILEVSVYLKITTTCISIGATVLSRRYILRII